MLVPCPLPAHFLPISCPPPARRDTPEQLSICLFAKHLSPPPPPSSFFFSHLFSFQKSIFILLVDFNFTISHKMNEETKRSSSTSFLEDEESDLTSLVQVKQDIKRNTIRLVKQETRINIVPFETCDYSREIALVNEKKKHLAEPNLQWFDFFFEMLNEQSQATTTAPNNENLDLFYLFFNLLIPITPLSLLNPLLNRLNSAVTQRLYYSGFCTRKDWVRRSLKWIQSFPTSPIIDSVLQLIFNLCSFNIGAVEFSALVDCIRSDWSTGKFRNFFVEMLHKLANQKLGPTTMFDFHGEGSGLLLPLESKKWPKSGYTFLTWLRIETFLMAENNEVYHPRLFSCISNDSSLEFFFDRNQLCIQAKKNAKKNAKKSSYSFRYKFNPKEWYFISIIHSSGTFKKSQVSLIVNGEMIESIPFVYPKFELLPQCCYLANNGALEALQVSNDKKIFDRPQPLIAQLGEILLLGDAVDPMDLKAIYSKCGPNMKRISNNESTAIVFGQSDSTFYLDKKEVKIVFSYSPQSVDGLLCFDTSNYEIRNNAVKLEGVTEWITFNVVQTLYSYGGYRSLLILFSNKNNDSLTANMEHLLSLCLAVAEDSPTAFKREMTISYAFPIIGYLLEQPGPDITENDLIAVKDLSTFILRTYGPEDMLKEMVIHVLFNFRIWTKTSFEIQQKIITMFSPLILAEPQFFRYKIGIESLTDIVKFFYWINPPKWLEVDENIMKNRLKSNQIKVVRAAILKLVSVLLGNDALKTEEVMAISNLFVSCSEDQKQELFETFKKPLETYLGSLADIDSFLEKWNSTSVKPSPNFQLPIPPLNIIAYTRPLTIQKWRSLVKHINRDPFSPTWRLDLSENGARMRRRLKKQHNPYSYQGAAKDPKKEFAIPKKIGKQKYFDEISNQVKLQIGNGLKIVFSNLKPHEVFRQGFLSKLGGKVKNWKTRFFVLRSSSLEYRWESKKLGLILLENAMVSINEEKFTDYSFEVRTPRRIFLLKASTRTEMAEWIRDIKNAIPERSQNTSSSLPPEEDLTSHQIFLSSTTMEELIYKCKAEYVTPMGALKGVFEITKTHLQFFSRKSIYLWNLQDLDVYFRRFFLLRNTAIEIFLKDRTSFFLNFSRDDIEKVLEKLVAVAPHIFTNSPEKYVAKFLKMWEEREISNFEYLMVLNTAAGRTYSDLNQYPIFPWIIADYKSSVLDLHSPAIYRDLSKPIGALNEKRLAQFIERFQNFEDQKIPPFHYGTHYSNAGAVLHYLMRIEPFTYFSVQLGGGQFDHADRMFNSVASAWEGVLTNNSNVRELIPEFFYFPEFLVNGNNVYFGKNLNGQAIGDVELPPWAKSAEEFVQINREALESEYVSAHLNEWIDLIFGYKQRGKEAEKAFNLFYYLTYPGQIDIDAVTDPVERLSLETQVLNFGQCPNQLFSKPHPKRKPNSSIERPLFERFYYSRKISSNSSPSLESSRNISSPSEDIISLKISQPIQTESQISELSSKKRRSNVVVGNCENPIHRVQFNCTLPIVSVFCINKSVLVIFKDGTVLTNTYISKSNRQNDLASFNFLIDRQKGMKLDLLISRQHVSNLSHCFTLVENGDYLACSGYPNYSFKIYQLNSIKPWKNFINEHRDVIACIASSRYYLVTASNDGQIKVWETSSLRIGSQTLKLLWILFGHIDKITCLAIDYQEDLIVSGSLDRTCILHSIREGRYLRTICFKEAPEILKIAGEYIVSLCEEKYLYVHTCNGKLMWKGVFDNPIISMCLSRCGKYIITGGTDVVVIQLNGLKPFHSFEMPSIVRSLNISPDDNFIFAGLENGEFYILPFSKYNF